MSLLKKTASVLLATTMLATSLISVSAAENPKTEEKYTALTASYVNENGELVNNIDKADETAPLRTAARTALPSSYNSADYGYVTPVKHQGTTSTCWAHAVMAACESSLIKNNGYDTSLDLAELHLAYSRSHTKADALGMFDSPADFTFPENFVDLGGGTMTGVFVLAGVNGVVTESANHGQFASEKMHFNNSGNFEVYNKEDLYSHSEARINNAYEVYTTDADAVKEHIMKYGAGSVAYLNGDHYYNEETGAFYCYDADTDRTSHAVTLVGWDDNYPKENCTANGHTPEHDGAWLFKNSYGTEQGNDGYNWISYEDNSIKLHPAVFYDLSVDDEYMNTYQYDELTAEVFLANKNKGETDIEDPTRYNNLFEGGAYMSNVFTATKNNEVLKEVSFYTSNEKLDYTVDIYTDVEGDTDPTNGTLMATVSGEDLLMGYHTIELPEPVALNKGEKFSVVINIKDNQDSSRGVFVNIDSVSQEDEIKISEYGESFVSTDGENWDDLKTSIDANMRIKAFTVSDDEPAELTDYYDSYNGKTREDLLSELNTTLKRCDGAINSTYTYSKGELKSLNKVCNYVKDVCKNADNFLALDFFKMNEALSNTCDNLSAYNIEDDIYVYQTNIQDYIRRYNSFPEYYEFLNVYNSVVKEANNVTLNEETAPKLIDTVYQAYAKFMISVINQGANFSEMANYGDVDNSGDINIKDATEIQKLLSDSMYIEYYTHINYDVDGDYEINIKDATEVQMYISKYTEYLPAYAIGVDVNIDFATAESNLETTVKEAESLDSFNEMINHPFTNTDFNLLCQYNEALSVLENVENYHPVVIQYTANRLNGTVQNIKWYC